MTLVQALEKLSFGGRTISETMMAQSRIVLFWYFTTYLLLEKNKPKYQRLEPPPVVEPTKPTEMTEVTEPGVESDDSPGQSFEILETPAVDQGAPQLNMFDLDGF